MDMADLNAAVSSGHSAYGVQEIKALQSYLAENREVLTWTERKQDHGQSASSNSMPVQGTPPLHIFRRILSSVEFAQIKAVLDPEACQELQNLAANEFDWALSIHGHVVGFPGRVDFASALTALRQLTYLQGLPSLDTEAVRWYFELAAGRDHANSRSDDGPSLTVEEFFAAWMNLLRAAVTPAPLLPVDRDLSRFSPLPSHLRFGGVLRGGFLRRPPRVHIGVLQIATCADESLDLDPAGLLQTKRRGAPLVRPDAAARLLIVWHSRTGMAEQMAAAMGRGARDVAHTLDQEHDLAVDLRRAAEAQVDDLLCSQGYLFCAPENLASVSGEMKEFFDRCYYGALGHITARPYALAVSGGTDGEGAARQMARICQGWRLRQSADPLILRNGAQTPEAIAAPKTCSDAEQACCEELGGLLAAQILLVGS